MSIRYSFCGQDSISVEDEEPPACVCPSVVTPSGCCLVALLCGGVGKSVGFTRQQKFGYQFLY